MSEPGFLDPLDLRQIGWGNGRPLWSTLAPLRYRSRMVPGIIEIPAEFYTDLASVPRLPLVWLAVGGRGPRSSVLHDFPYQFGEWIIDGLRTPVTRSLVDRVFHESLLADPWSGANRARAWQMWAGVRVGGRGVWSRDRAASLNPVWSEEWREA